MSALALRSPVVADVLLPAVLDAMNDGVLLVDPAHRIEFANLAGLRISGYAGEALAGRPFKDLVPDVDLDVLLNNGWKQPSPSEPDLTPPPHATLHKADGSTAPVELSVTEVRFNRGQLLLVVIRDVSERARLAEHLGEARKLSVIGTFTGGMAHELSDLFSAIQVTVEGLSERAPAGGERRVSPELEHLRAAALRGASLAEQLLQLGRVGQIDLRPVDLVTVLEGISPTLHRLLPPWIALNCRAEPGPLPVRAAPAAVEEMVLELVANARDAMPRGGLLTIDLRAVQIESGIPARGSAPPPGAYVCLSVDDTGEGLDADARAKVFTPFFSTKPGKAGSGLGTAIVYGLMKQHGGYATLHSAARRGTTFRLFFPALERAHDTAPERAQRPGITTVLVVDDEEPLLKISRRALEHCGYRVLTAARGNDALVILREHRAEIAVVVSDLSMPGLGGRELHEIARQEGIGIPFLFTSGHAPGEASEDPAAPQDPSFLRKPWTIDDLVRRVRQVMEGRTSQ